MSRRVERAFRLKYAQLLAHWPVVPPGFDFEAQLATARAARPFGSLAQELDANYRRMLSLTDHDPAAGESRRNWIASVKAGGARFDCDASLGGLARWLRAYGYEARQGVTIKREDLRARASLPACGYTAPAIFLTSDGDLYGRALGAAALAPVLWQASQVRPPAQLQSVVGELRLERRDPLCMACGGVLKTVTKGEVSEWIPPRTARWLDIYFVCGRCDGLFWRGTHWEKITRQLSKIAASLGGSL